MRKRYRAPKTIYKRGKWFCFRITDSFGKRKVIKSPTREDALVKLRTMPQQMMSDMSDAVSYRITVGQGIDYWLGHKKGAIQDRSIERYRTDCRHLQDFINAEYPRYQFFDETQKEDDFALNYRRYRFSKGRATKTVKDEEETLSNLYTFLAKKKKIHPRNPFNELEPITVEPVQKRRVLPKDELRKFFIWAKKISEAIFWYGVYMVLYMTTMRRDELRVMEKSQVNFETGFFEIPVAKNKKGKVISKTIPIHPQLRPILQEAIARSKSKYLFPNTTGKPMPKNKMRDTMLRICKKSGIPQATLNDLRHTWSTKTRLAGMSNEARWCSDDVMNSVYTHYPESKISEEYFKVNFLDFEDELDA